MKIEDRIGVSTISMTGVSVQEAIRLIGEAGFKAIEIWSADFQGIIGYPLQPAVGIWPRTCSKDIRREIRNALCGFQTIIIHVQLYGGVDIASINPGIREESRRQYLECLELGVDLGASHVTYHSGALRDVLGANGPEWRRQAWDHNVDMARTLVAESEGTDILLGYESGAIPQSLDLIDAIGRPRFGLLLDVAHAAMAVEDHSTDGILADMDLCAGKLVEVHAHGLWADVCVLRDHQDARKNNCLDYGRIMPKLRQIGYEGPFIFEICAPDASGVVERCVEFKDVLTRGWEAGGQT